MGPFLPRHEPLEGVANFLLVDSLKKIRDQLSLQRRHLDEIDDHIQELEKDKSGKAE